MCTSLSSKRIKTAVANSHHCRTSYHNYCEIMQQLVNQRETLKGTDLDDDFRRRKETKEAFA